MRKFFSNLFWFIFAAVKGVVDLLAFSIGVTLAGYWSLRFIEWLCG